MQYLLLLRFREGEGPQEGTPEFDAEMQRWDALLGELKTAGTYVGATGLKPESVTTVRAPGGQRAVTDGPYAETKEILFSFIIVDLEDLDAATALAERLPAAEYGSIEIYATDGLEVA